MKRSGYLLAAALTFSFALLGCVQPDEGEANARARLGGRGGSIVDGALGFDPLWYEKAMANGADHSHLDLTHHLNLTTPNFELVGWNPLVTDYHGKAAGGYFCGDVAPGDDRRLAVVHSWVSDVAFILLDITDPTDPQKVSELAMPDTHVYDLAITPDQKYVLLATSPLDTGPDDATPVNGPGTDERAMTVRDGCTGEERLVDGPEQNAPFASGVILVDITNPRNPVIQDFRFFPILGGHSVYAADLGGETIIAVTASNLGASNYYVFMTILDTPAGPKFEQQSIVTSGTREPTEARSQLAFGNHDAFLQTHPITGDHIAYLADGHWGLTVLNINDVTAPVEIARWANWDEVGGPDDSHFIHETFPIEGTWDGRHYMFMGEECLGRPPRTPSCLIYTMDTTDPAKPTLVGAWTFPFDAGNWDYPTFSPHYMTLVERTLFISSFHGGVWAVDVSTPEAMATMPSIGVFLPDKSPPKGYAVEDQYHRFPETADVVATGDGHIITWDATSGAYVLSFDATNPAPPPTPWDIITR